MTRGRLRAAARDLFVEPERASHLAPRRRVVRVCHVPGEEALGQILRIRGVVNHRRDEGADGRVVPLGKLVERRGRRAAVAGSVREQIPRRERELPAYRRTLLLRVFGGQRTYRGLRMEKE